MAPNGPRPLRYRLPRPLSRLPATVPCPQLFLPLPRPAAPPDGATAPRRAQGPCWFLTERAVSTRGCRRRTASAVSSGVPLRDSSQRWLPALPRLGSLATATETRACGGPKSRRLPREGLRGPGGSQSARFELTRFASCSLRRSWLLAVLRGEDAN